jgi:tetratricopeptide (TPR) repeat protein
LIGQYEQAIAALKQALSRNPDFLGSHLALAVSYREAGLLEEARSHVAEALRISPGLSLEVWRQRLPFKDEALLERVLGALSEAGME